MSSKHLSICIVSAGMTSENLRLQPWRYLFEVARGLGRQGYNVTILTDGGRGHQQDWLEGVSRLRLPDVRVFPWQRPTLIEAALDEISTSFILLNIGLTSFLHQDFRLWSRWPAIGIFTSPIYTFKELARLGPGKLWRGRSASAIHLLGSLIPRWLLRSRMLRSGLRRIVVQTYTTRDQLLEGGLWQGEVDVIPPGVDPAWGAIPLAQAGATRRDLGYTPSDVVVVYFGSPAELRGLPVLLRALALARETNPALKLLALSRRRAGELERETASLERSIATYGRGDHTHLVDGFLSVEALARHVAAGDIVALPFELLPSDAPLGPLEAQALGVPLVATRLACLPELAGDERSYLAEPGDPVSLAVALLQAADNVQSLPSGHNSVRDWGEIGLEWDKLLYPTQSPLTDNVS